MVGVGFDERGALPFRVGFGVEVRPVLDVCGRCVFDSSCLGLLILCGLV